MLRACGGGWLVEYGRECRNGRVFVVLATDPTPFAPIELVTAVVARRFSSVLPAALDAQMKMLGERRREGGLGWAPPGPHVLGAVVPRHGPTELEAWADQGASRVEALRARVDPREALLLDRTLESLRMVAALALADLDAGLLHDSHGAPTEAHRQYEAYVGETVFRHRGASWVLFDKVPDQDFRDRFLRLVTAGRETRLFPRGVLQELATTRSPETLVDHVKVFLGKTS